jgi:hypothetical protein
LETLDMGVDHKDTRASQQGGTAQDENEMQRMGKIQEFKVCFLLPFAGIQSRR